jgi:hypothetical protein
MPTSIRVGKADLDTVWGVLEGARGRPARFPAEAAAHFHDLSGAGT